MEIPGHTFRRTASGLGLFYGWFGAMHSRLDVIITGKEEDCCRALLDSMFSRTVYLEKRLNRFDPDSDIWQINNFGEGALPIDDEMIDILAGAAHYKTLTHGTFDIAIHTKDYDPKAEYLDIDFENFVLNITCQGVTLDMGGYAKGLALEEMVEILRKGGVENALVSFGNSSIYGLGKHPLEKPWSVGVASTSMLTNGNIAFSLENCAMSSSGNNNSNRGHIISPFDSKPINDNCIISVSGASPLDCEVLSTALFVAVSKQNENDKHIKGEPDHIASEYSHNSTASNDNDSIDKNISGENADKDLVASIISNFDVNRVIHISFDKDIANIKELVGGKPLE